MDPLAAVDPSPVVVVWESEVPTHCQITKQPIGNVFIDGRTVMGPWACMTPEAHDRYGVGLGTGRGQRYEVQASGVWLKIAG